MKAPRPSQVAKYGITPEQWTEVLKSQGYGCGICRRPFKNGRVPHCDHDHDSGLFRGLLDFRCNNELLGHFGDRTEIFQGAVAYLLEPPATRLGITARHRDAPPPLTETLVDFEEDR